MEIREMVSFELGREIKKDVLFFLEWTKTMHSNKTHYNQIKASKCVFNMSNPPQTFDLYHPS